MQKQRKFNQKKGAHKFQSRKKVESQSWQPVKLSGPVIADEGADFGGFVGLEILENYSGDFVRKERRKGEKVAELNGKKKKTKRKFSDDSDDDESDSEEEVKPKKKQKKSKPAKRNADDSSEDDSGFDDQPKRKKKDTVNKRLATKTVQSDDDSDESHEEEAAPAFSMLLKPPKVKQTEQKVKDTVKGSVAPVPTNNTSSKKQAKNSKQNETAKGPGKSNAKPDSNGKTTQEKSKNNNKAEKPKSEPYSTVDYMAWIQLGVSEPIVRALADKGFKVPTEIQTQSLPVAIYGRRDLLGAAETGSGKTLAFGIPMLEGIMRMKTDTQNDIDNSNEHEMTPPPEDIEISEEDKRVFAEEGKALGKNFVEADKPLYGLILTPTRELAVQINDHLKAVAKYTGINIATVFGGLAAVKQERLLRKCPEIVIATPGRLWELIQNENHHLSKVADIRYLVIDETDRMLEKGHFEELKQLLELINANEEAKKLRRNYIFSATLTMDHEMPDHLKKNVKKSKKVLKLTPGQRMDNLIEVIGMTNPKIVDLTQDHGTARTLTQSRILCKADHKDFYLYYFLERHPGRTLVFCNSIDCVKRLVSLFDYLDCQPLSLFGSMQQRQRLKNLERFTANPRAVLIATDVAARGLDIPNVDHVIHYQVPKTTENYVHRSGRTARASKEGLTVLLIAPNEVKDYVKLNQDLGRTEDLPLYPTSERMMRQVKDRVLLAREIEHMDHKQRREGAERSWEDQLAKEFRDDSEEDSEQEDMRRLEDTKRKRMFKAKRLELSKLLAKPIVPERIEMNYPSLNISGMVNPQTEKNPSAISIVRNAEQQRLLEKKQRKNKKKTY
uniref:ATP-dependent RNA helicase n=1 Tax=Anopheles culicifacies TaxID=139723 RepID=A0A182LW13_9DIPT